MKNMTINQLAKVCNGQLFGTNLNTAKEATGVVIDSRKVEPDYIFIATVGERVDGHNYINSAFDQGALAVICEKLPIDPKGACILVKDSFAALKDIAKWYRLQLDIKVVGITGSVGKTSTKEFISSVLSMKYHVLKTEGNFNNEVGLPLTILKIKREHQIAVLEMGISHFGEMHRLSEIAKPDICVITNIGQCHLENLGSRQGILKAKTEIFDFMSDNGRVCINGDDDMLATLKEIKGYSPLRFGLGSGNDCYADRIKTNGLFGSTCDIHFNGTAFSVDIPLPGEHMVLNALAASSVGFLLGMKAEEIAEGINSAQPVGGRSHIIRQEKLTIIDDCYNANPVSMKSAIDLLAMADTRKVAILGDMGELGSNENTLHQDVGAYAASANTDVIVCVGELSKYIYDKAKETITKNADGNQADKKAQPLIYYFKTREELIQALPTLVKPNDTILVKASHFMQFENVIKALRQDETTNC